MAKGMWHMVGRLQLEAYVHINTDTEFQHSVDQHMQYIQCSNKLFDLLIYLFTDLLIYLFTFY